LDSYSTGDVPDLTADPSLANKELGFTCKYGLDEMARDQWGFNKKYPQGKFAIFCLLARAVADPLPLSPTGYETKK
jgi:hypothetical protein